MNLLHSILFTMLLFTSANAEKDQETLSCYSILQKIDLLNKNKIEKMTDNEETALKTALLLTGAGWIVGDINAESNKVTTDEKIKELRKKLKNCVKH